jgi:hypothetical protein
MYEYDMAFYRAGRRTCFMPRCSSKNFTMMQSAASADEQPVEAPQLEHRAEKWEPVFRKKQKTMRQQKHRASRVILKSRTML